MSSFEGIRRFEDGDYSQCMPQAGMIAFLESGELEKLRKMMLNRLPEKSLRKQNEDCSLQYNFPYVYRTIHKRGQAGSSLSLHHILLDLTVK